MIPTATHQSGFHKFYFEVRSTGNMIVAVKDLARGFLSSDRKV